MKLSLLNRITLLQFLPNSGNFELLVTRKSIINKIDITVEELDRYKIKTSIEGFITMSQESTNYLLEIEFCEIEIKEIIKALEKAKQLEELPSTFLDLYELFIKQEEK